MFPATHYLNVSGEMVLRSDYDDHVCGHMDECSAALKSSHPADLLNAVLPDLWVGLP